jgi:hypothetical protein
MRCLGTSADDFIAVSPSRKKDKEIIEPIKYVLVVLVCEKGANWLDETGCRSQERGVVPLSLLPPQKNASWILSTC